MKRSGVDLLRLTRTAREKSDVVIYCEEAVGGRVVVFDEDSAWKVGPSFWCYIILYRVFVYDPLLSLT